MPVQRGFKYFSVEKQDRALGLILRGGRNVPLHGKVRQKHLDFVRPYLLRMPQSVEANVAPYPVDIDRKSVV